MRNVLVGMILGVANVIPGVSVRVVHPFSHPLKIAAV